MRTHQQLVKWIGGVIAAAALLAGCRSAAPLPQTGELPPSGAASAAGLETATPTLSASPGAPGAPGGAVEATAASAPATTDVPIPSTAGDSLNCTYSAGFWLANPQRWLTDNLVIGSLTFSRQSALEILAQSPQDMTTQVLHEFFATALNILKGADAQAIQVELNQAGEWIRQHPTGLLVAGEALQQGQQLAARLGAYNRGEIGPGRCSDEPLPTATATPTATSTPTATATRRPPASGGRISTPTRPRPGQPGNPPPINPPPTQAPPTQAPPTQAPPTQAPPTQAPPTNPPPTQAPPPPPPPPTPAPPPTATPAEPSPEPADPGPGPVATP